jgi:hypothetical protein
MREELAAGERKVLPLKGGGDEIYLVIADPESLGL